MLQNAFRVDLHLQHSGVDALFTRQGQLNLFNNSCMLSRFFSMLR